MHAHSSRNYRGRVSTTPRPRKTTSPGSPLAEDERDAAAPIPRARLGSRSPASTMQGKGPGTFRRVEPASQAGTRREAIIMQWGTWDGLGWARARFIWRGAVGSCLRGGLWVERGLIQGSIIARDSGASLASGSRGIAGMFGVFRCWCVYAAASEERTGRNPSRAPTAVEHCRLSPASRGEENHVPASHCCPETHLGLAAAPSCHLNKRNHKDIPPDEPTGGPSRADRRASKERPRNPKEMKQDGFPDLEIPPPVRDVDEREPLKGKKEEKKNSLVNRGWPDETKFEKAFRTDGDFRRPELPGLVGAGGESGAARPRCRAGLPEGPRSGSAGWKLGGGPLV